MFETERFVADCRAAFAKDPTHKAVREVLACAVSDPTAVLKGLGEPQGAEIKKIFHSDALTEAMEEGHLLAEPPAISGGAGLEYPFRSVTPPCEYVTVRIGGRAVSMENLRLRKAAPTS